ERLFVSGPTIEGSASSQEYTKTVIPAKAGIQFFQGVTKALDPGLRRDDDFLRGHQLRIIGIR
ncbi:MAG: hypothetical protein ABIM40_14290, partial [Pseudomonadota bacterium]